MTDEKNGTVRRYMAIVVGAASDGGPLAANVVLEDDHAAAIATLRAENECVRAERDMLLRQAETLRLMRQIARSDDYARHARIGAAVERLTKERATNLIGDTNSTWKRLARILETHVGPVPWTALLISDRAPTAWHIEHATALLNDPAALAAAVAQIAPAVEAGS